MSDFIVESVTLNVDAENAYEYIRDPANLPEWTNAFRTIDGESALMETPKGRVEVGLHVVGSPELRTVDWKMVFPDGREGWAWSRIFPFEDDRCFYSFVLPKPPDELEQIEGDLATQAGLLREELKRLQSIMKENVC